jgi:hypothetical protein
MPNPGVSKRLKCQHRMEDSSVASRDCRNYSDRSSAEGEFFTTQAGNVVNVETVETRRLIDRPEDHPTALALRFKRLKRLQQAGQFRCASGSGNVGAQVRWKANEVEPGHQLTLVNRKIEVAAVYGI